MSRRPNFRSLYSPGTSDIAKLVAALALALQWVMLELATISRNVSGISTPHLLVVRLDCGPLRLLRGSRLVALGPTHSLQRCAYWVTLGLAVYFEGRMAYGG